MNAQTGLSNQELEARRAALKKQCTQHWHGFAEPPLHRWLSDMATWAEVAGADNDSYGQGTLIASFESKVAKLLGLDDAVFMPSGVMAQLIAIGLWSERKRLRRFGLHVTSHLVGHEEQAYEAILGLQGAFIGAPTRPIVADDLAGYGDALACLIVELPMREIGGALPSWDELEALKAIASDRGIALHMDGARLWEAGPFYGRPYADIVAGFSSVYVSVYKGLGGIAGALLAGDAAFCRAARLWRRRFGGTLIHQSPMIVSAAMRMDERLAVLPACYERAKRLASALSACPGIRVLPNPPQCNMMHLFFDRPVADLLAARDRIAQSHGVWLFGAARAADVPGQARIELYVGDGLLARSDDDVVPLFCSLLEDKAT